MKDTGRRISVLDVTLRDGGCVNDFNFGTDYMRGILSSLESSRVDYIELGYIDDKKGAKTGRTKYINEKVIPSALDLVKKPGTVYLAMMDFGKFNPLCLSRCDGKGIDGIRLAFHKKDWDAAIDSGRIILEKGYKLFIQPMLTMHYSDDEMSELVERVNSMLPAASAFYLVDSFGEMRHDELSRLVNIVDRSLNPDIALGLHSHNNLQLSYSLAMSLMRMPLQRRLFIDSSLMGMGKGAGNLCTELLIEQLNLYHGGDYELRPVLEVIDRVIKVLHQETPWGYSVEYYLSSVNHCTPSYASYFYNKHMLSIDQVSELLSMLKEDKRISFDEGYANEVYLRYRADDAYDDSHVVAGLGNYIRGKKVLIIAPGMTAVTDRDKILAEMSVGGLVSMELNSFDFNTDYKLITRPELIERAVEKYRDQVVTTTRLADGETSGAKVLNFRRWIESSGAANDSSAVIAINLLRYLGAEELILAGFDGFSVDVNANYGDRKLRRPLTECRALACNSFFKDFLSRVSGTVRIRFLTASLYEV